MSYGQVKFASDEPVKTKRPGFLARWFLKKLVEGAEYEKRQNQDSIVGSNQLKGLSVGPVSIDQPERAMQFTVYNANGGRVVETRRYDKKTDRSATGLYVITSDADFGREIDKIITMEALK
jgi:hypothetical protein